jgi:hypothetical protein
VGRYDALTNTAPTFKWGTGRVGTRKIKTEGNGNGFLFVRNEKASTGEDLPNT